MTDRVEAIAILIVIATALLVVPTAAQSGTDVYAAQMHAIADQTRSLRQVDAEVIHGAVGTVPNSTALPVVVQWRDGAQTHTGRAAFSSPTTTGERVVIWLDKQGNIVDAPKRKSDAELSAFVRSAGVWLGAVALSALMAYLVRRWLDRLRAKAWERELQLLAHNDDGWANRRT